jgi:hypothetical protein
VLRSPERGERERAGRSVAWLGLGCLAGLLLIAYRATLFEGGQLAYRDASHHYDPLYQRVHREWQAGRLPLWAPEDQGGAPLLGNPTAAVLYPGQVLFAPLPFRWGMRAYVGAHTLLAALAMAWLMRSWRASWAGSWLAGLAYAFGGPVLFQSCNLVYLVGAAWLPMGLLAADGWIRHGSPSALGGLSVVLALEVLGGDPQAAVLTLLAALGYAVGQGSRRVLLVFVWGLIGLFIAWILVAPVLGGAPSWARSTVGQAVVLGFWALGGGIALMLGRRGPGARPGPALPGLIGAATLAVGLSAAQLFPVAEAMAQSVRAAPDGPLARGQRFALEPLRCATWAWPNAVERVDHQERSLLIQVGASGGFTPWAPSLYLGGATIVLALAGFGGRRGAPGRAWMSALAVFGLLASLGPAGGPRWWLGLLGGTGSRSAPGDDSVFALLATIVPGFAGFRFPAKLLTITSLALAALAGLGWDRARDEPAIARRAKGVALSLLLVSLAVLVGLVAYQPALTAWLSARGEAAVTMYGPADPAGALADLRRGLMHGALALAAVLGGLLMLRGRPLLAGRFLLVALAIDLAVASEPLVVTVPGSIFEHTPRVLRAIAAAELDDPSPGPFRVHHLEHWVPDDWTRHGSPRRLQDWVRWEWDTIHPLYGLALGVESTIAQDAALMPYDLWRYFRPVRRRLPPPTTAALGLPPGQAVVHQPRRAIDLWGARYLIVPANPSWIDPMRSDAGLQEQVEPIAADLPADVRLLRNRAAYPRAWIVHEGRVVPPVHGGPGPGPLREAIFRALLYQPDPYWNVSGRPVLDPHRVALVESDDRAAVSRFLPGGESDGSEYVRVVHHEPRRVELEARLARSGLVILAETFDPGWTLAIDGEPAGVLRVNRLMRGAAVAAGTHRLVYRYDPLTFRVGLGVSLVSLAVLGGLILLRRGAAGVVLAAGRVDNRQPGSEEAR